MRLDLDNLPSDVELLQRLVRDMAGAVATRDGEIGRLQALIKQLQRMQFGKRSEQLDPSQLLLALEDLDADIARIEESVPSAPADPPSSPSRKPLPDHLPRENVVLDVGGDACPCCGGAVHAIGESVSEMLDWVPAQLRVLRILRPKYACRTCKNVVQAAAPERLIANGLATPGLIAQVLVAKYCDHTPLYRQSKIFARHGVDLPRSTLAGWVGGASWWLEALHRRLSEHVFGSDILFADDTPVPVLDPGRGRTKTGRLWAYAREQRGWSGADPPAAVFIYAPDRRAERPEAHLARFEGVLHVDGYAGFERLTASGKIKLAACWAHTRRKFYEIAEAEVTPLATEALRASPCCTPWKSWCGASLRRIGWRSAGRARSRSWTRCKAGLKRRCPACLLVESSPRQCAMPLPDGTASRDSSTTAASNSTPIPSSGRSGQWHSGARTICSPDLTVGPSVGRSSDR